MFVLRPSSPLAAAQAPFIDAPLAGGSFIDQGQPIPESYDVEIVRAMLQDPFHVFVYWDVRPSSLDALTRYFSPEDARTFRVTLKLTEIEGRNEAFFDVDRRGRYWMTVFPGREYEFEVGVRSPIHGYIPIVRSNRVETPRGTVSPEPSPEPEYQLSAPELLGVLEASGFAADQALSLTLAAAAGGTPSDVMTAILQRMPASLREALFLAAAGEPLTFDLISELPEPLRSALLDLYFANDGLIAAIALMHYLPEFLRELIEIEREWFGQVVHPLHFAPRFFQGGTENLCRPGEELRWPRLPHWPSSAELIRRFKPRL
ncbi:MAG TPA: DUF4912 domain-containing protein [Blastocatellia bacterium]|nr:DUF4912 domain-containing protein [Blastocatellia bacterium]